MPESKRGGAVLRVVSGSNVGRTYPVDQSFSIGRDPTNDLQLLDGKSSRRHAVIERRGDGWVIVDQGSRNGTWVNDAAVATQPLTQGDKIYVGDTVMEFVLPVSAAAADSISGGSTGGLTLILKAERDAPASGGERFDVRSQALLAARGQDDAARLRALNDKLRKVYEVGRALSSVRPLPEVLSQVLQILFDILPAERGVILLREGDRGFVPVAGRTRSGDVSGELPVSRTILEKVVAERVALLSGDVSRDSRVDPSESIVVQGITSCLTAPMLLGDEVLGLVHVDTVGSMGAFSSEDLEIVSSVASQAAIAVQNARLLATVEQEALVRDNLSRYLGPELVERVLKHEASFTMEGAVEVATILFADIRGFTAMSERLPPQLVVKMLNEYFEIMVDIIIENGGVVDKFVGDEIMAVWGVPEARPDDAFKAVSAAVRMQQALCSYNERRRLMNQEPIYMGIGLNTGPVVAGNLGSSKRMQFTVIGDAVNLASRIEHLTEKEQIVINATTYELVKDRVRAVAKEPVKVKGKQELVSVYEVRGLLDLAAATPGRRHDRVRTAFPVGCVRLATKRAFAAVLLDISVGGAGMQYRVDAAPDLVQGDAIVLVVAAQGTARHVVRGRVARLTEAGGRAKGCRVAGVAFDEAPGAVEAAIEVVLAAGISPAGPDGDTLGAASDGPAARGKE